MKIHKEGMDSGTEKRLREYDKTEDTVFTEMPAGERDGISFKNACHLCGNIANLVLERQDRLYADYREGHIYGSELEDYVKLYVGMDILVTWYTEGGHTGSISYSDNIQVRPVCVSRRNEDEAGDCVWEGRAEIDETVHNRKKSKVQIW